MSVKLYRKARRINLRDQRVQEMAGEEVVKRESKLAMIQALIPLGLKAVEEELQGEVRLLVGDRYERGNGSMKRWGANPGSVFVGDQKLRVNVPRVRDLREQREIPLKSYERLQEPHSVDEMAFNRVINGISQGRYERAVEHVHDTFGISKSSVSRKFIRASAQKLQEFVTRDLKGYDIVAVFIDGKHFAENEMVIALGVTLSGEKVLLGFVETSTENHKVCRDFLRGLATRGLKLDQEVLFVIDGAKGLYKGIQMVVGENALIARCQWHKRENVVSYLAKERQDEFRRKLQAAYSQSSYDLAKRALMEIRAELRQINESAVSSLDEGLEETLLLQRLGMFEKLGKSFKTTNCIENVNRSLESYTSRVSRWQNSDQRRRWVASVLMEVEPGLNKVMGHEHLKELRVVMKRYVGKRNITQTKDNAK
jgi:putative transposase